MKMYENFYWPDSDEQCHPVVTSQLPDVKKALIHVVKFKRCIQAGGNVGVWPKYLSKHFDEVVTFEPDEENFGCLLENVDERNVVKVRGALGSHRGTTGLLRDPKNVGAHLTQGEGDIEIFRIDDLQGPVDFIQLDVEGDELYALMGAVRTLETDHPVLMLEDKNIKEPKGKVETFLADFGYRVVDRIHRDIILV